MLAALLFAGTGCGGSKSSDGPAVLKLSIAANGCAPKQAKAKSGPVTFQVSNTDKSVARELELKTDNGVILGEKENIVAGVDGAFTLTLQPGRYVLSCPKDGRDSPGTLVVTGERVPSPTLATAQLNAAVTGYRHYITAEIGLLVKGVNQFTDALDEGNLAQAKALFAQAREHYESIEPVAESFGDLDPKIDARVNDVAPGDKWTGFHRIEQILWVRGTTAGTAPYSRQLRTDVATLRRKAGTLFFQPAQLANGAVELLDEVGHSKITGEEDRYSHTDLTDFQANLSGSRKAFELLKPALVKEGDGDLADTIDARFAAVQKGLDKYRRSTPSGFAPYSELTAADRKSLSQALDALAEPLSTVAAKVS